MIQQFGEIWRDVDYFELDWRFDPYQPKKNHLGTILSFMVHIVAMHIRATYLYLRQKEKSRSEYNEFSFKLHVHISPFRL